MNCGERFNYGHGSSDTCGKPVWDEGSPKAVCDECRDKLIIKLVEHIDMDILNSDEYEFIIKLLKEA